MSSFKRGHPKKSLVPWTMKTKQNDCCRKLISFDFVLFCSYINKRKTFCLLAHWTIRIFKVLSYLNIFIDITVFDIRIHKTWNNKMVKENPNEFLKRSMNLIKGKNFCGFLRILGIFCMVLFDEINDRKHIHGHWIVQNKVSSQILVLLI